MNWGNITRSASSSAETSSKANFGSIRSSFGVVTGQLCFLVLLDVNGDFCCCFSRGCSIFEGIGSVIKNAAPVGLIFLRIFTFLETASIVFSDLTNVFGEFGI
jgi:hypothetical protein